MFTQNELEQFHRDGYIIVRGLTNHADVAAMKAIAEQAGYPMPTFFGYMLRYTLPVLMPVFVVVTWVFFV